MDRLTFSDSTITNVLHRHAICTVAVKEFEEHLPKGVLGSRRPWTVANDGPAVDTGLMLEAWVTYFPVRQCWSITLWLGSDEAIAYRDHGNDFSFWAGWFGFNSKESAEAAVRMIFGKTKAIIDEAIATPGHGPWLVATIEVPA